EVGQGREQVQVVMGFPVGSAAGRTPGAHDVETCGLISYARPDGPSQIEEGKTAVSRLKRPFQGRAGWSSEVEDEPIRQIRSRSFCGILSHVAEGSKSR